MKQKRINQSRRGFTLLEIIGVIAVIAILAAVLAPRVGAVIGRGKVNSTVASLTSLSTATTDYISANSALPVRAGTGASDAPGDPLGRFDSDLQAGGHLEKLFACGIGVQPAPDGSSATNKLTTRTHVRVLKARTVPAVSIPSATAGGDNYNLDRDDTKADFSTGQMVASAFIPGVALADAVAINKQIDGVVNSSGKGDTAGRCIYSNPSSAGTVTVYVYLGHH